MAPVYLRNPAIFKQAAINAFSGIPSHGELGSRALVDRGIGTALEDLLVSWKIFCEFVPASGRSLG